MEIGGVGRSSIHDAQGRSDGRRRIGQGEAKLHRGIRDVAREIVGGWQGLADEDMGITVIS